MATDFEEVFDDIMHYVEKNKKYPAFRGSSEGDLREYLHSVDPKASLRRIEDKLIRTDAAQEMITEGSRRLSGEEKKVKKELARPRVVLPKEKKVVLREKIKAGKTIVRRGETFYYFDRKVNRNRDAFTGRFVRR